MKVLITGANGQLGMEFQRYFRRTANHTAIALSKDKLDIIDFNSVLESIAHHKPDIVLNCAAYNLIDKAENDPGPAFKVNAAGVKYLAAACNKYHAMLVHFSTDYVFDGTKQDFYTEDDSPNPINNYGKSKLSGEMMLAEETDNFIVFRVSWVFGEGKQSFLYKFSEWAKQNNVLKIVFDQVSAPTYTEDIVRYAMSAVENGVKGIYHLANSGYASRYEFAHYYAEKLRFANILLPVSSDNFQDAARRPYFSAMSNARISQALGVEIPGWRDAVDRFIRRNR